eukprot:jgi/Chrzof1/7877/Cz02g39220.t1
MLWPVCTCSSSDRHACAARTTNSGVALSAGILNYAFSDYLWARAVLLLGPTLATLGLSVQIPFAAATDAIRGDAKWLTNGKTTAMTVAGTLLILAGFFGGNLAGDKEVPGHHGQGESLDDDDDDDDYGGGGSHRHLRSVVDGGEHGAEHEQTSDTWGHDWDEGIGDGLDAELGIPVSSHARSGDSGARLGSNKNGLAGQGVSRGAGGKLVSLGADQVLHVVAGSADKAATGTRQSIELVSSSSLQDGSIISGSSSSSASSPSSSPKAVESEASTPNGVVNGKKPYRASRLQRTSFYVDEGMLDSVT